MTPGTPQRDSHEDRGGVVDPVDGGLVVQPPGVECGFVDLGSQRVEAGADAGSISIVEIDEIPLSYLPGNATRLRVKAVGNLSAAGI